jgi:hypothetical protein
MNVFASPSARRWATLAATLIAATATGFARAAAAGSGIQLQVTVGTDLAAGACGDATSLDVVLGDSVNFCYRVSNRSSTPLAYQAASDDIDGVIVAPGTNRVIAPGETYQYNRIASVAKSSAHVTTWTAQAAAPTYTATLRTGAFVDISARPSAINLDDGLFVGSYGGTRDVEMPFPFTFYGLRSNRLCVSDYGLAGVAQEDCRFSDDNNAVGPLPLRWLGLALLPLWDSFEHWPDGASCHDLCRFIYGALYADTLGSAPNRKFLVQWSKRIHAPISQNADGASFEIVFDEASGAFSFEYGDVDYTASLNGNGDPAICDGGACATIGVQADAQTATQFSRLQAAVSSGSGIDWTPNAAYSAESTVSLSVGRPELRVPAAIDVGAVVGARGTATLTIANDGDRSLNWHADAQRPPLQARAPADDAVPAFGVHATDLILVSDNQYAHFDPTVDGSLSAIATIDGAFGGGTFIDNDFSRQYVTRGFKTMLGGNTAHGREYLKTIDTATGAITTIGPTGMDDTPRSLSSGQALAWDAQSNTLYGVYQYGDGSADSGSYLVTLDRYTGAARRVGLLELDQAALDAGAEYVIGLAIDRSGAMYGIAAGSMDEDGSHGVLIAVDKATAATRTIGAFGADAPFLMPVGLAAFDLSSNQLYVNGLDFNDAMVKTYRVDLQTGTTTRTATITDALVINALSIARAGGPCVDDAGVPWLSAEPGSGTVAAGTSAEVALGIDARALAAGTYTADLCLRSDDPYRHTVPLRVNLHVAGDAIFADGFDAAARR